MKMLLWQNEMIVHVCDADASPILITFSKYSRFSAILFYNFMEL